MQALQTYTLLTVGEGLVTQIPALLISTATGLMVTKNGGKESLGWELMSQVLSKPKAVMITAGVFAVLLVVPGMPKVPLLVAAAGAGCVASFLMSSEKKTAIAEKIKAAQPADKPAVPESMTDLIGVDPLALEIGYGLIGLADPKQGGELLDRITMLRKQAAMDKGSARAGDQGPGQCPVEPQRVCGETPRHRSGEGGGFPRPVSGDEPRRGRREAHGHRTQSSPPSVCPRPGYPKHSVCTPRLPATPWSTRRPC